nr:uncharacterized protein LOC117837144 [Setaria viridis]
MAAGKLLLLAASPACCSRPARCWSRQADPWEISLLHRPHPPQRNGVLRPLAVAAVPVKTAALLLMTSLGTGVGKQVSGKGFTPKSQGSPARPRFRAERPGVEVRGSLTKDDRRRLVVIIEDPCIPSFPDGP